MPRRCRPPSRRSSRRRLPAVLAALVTAAGAVAGCAARPAPAADRTRPRPSRPRLRSTPRRSSRAAGRSSRTRRPRSAKILGTTDPQGQVVALFDQGGVQFARDIEPWLGDRVGAAALTLGKQGDKIVVAASRDDAAATAALGRILPGASERSYRGVSYRVATKDGRPLAAGVVGDAVVFGSENGLKAAVDASKGSSLAEGDQLKEARSTVRQERSASSTSTSRASCARRSAPRAGARRSSRRSSTRSPRRCRRPSPPRSTPSPASLRVDSAAFGNGGGARAAGSGADALAGLPGGRVARPRGRRARTDRQRLHRPRQRGQRPGRRRPAGAARPGAAGPGPRHPPRPARVDGRRGRVRRRLVGRQRPRGARDRVEGPGGDAARGARARDARAPQRRRLGPARAGRRRRVRGQASRRQAGLLVAAAGDKFVVAGGRRGARRGALPGGRLGDAPAFRDAAAKLAAACGRRTSSTCRS